jgi:hypothetical protein
LRGYSAVPERPDAFRKYASDLPHRGEASDEGHGKITVERKGANLKTAISVPKCFLNRGFENKKRIVFPDYTESRLEFTVRSQLTELSPTPWSALRSPPESKKIVRAFHLRRPKSN